MWNDEEVNMQLLHVKFFIIPHNDLIFEIMDYYPGK